MNFWNLIITVSSKMEWIASNTDKEFLWFDSASYNFLITKKGEKFNENQVKLNKK